MLGHHAGDIVMTRGIPVICAPHHAGGSPRPAATCHHRTPLCIVRPEWHVACCRRRFCTIERNRRCLHLQQVQTVRYGTLVKMFIRYVHTKMSVLYWLWRILQIIQSLARRRRYHYPLLAPRGSNGRVTIII